MKILKDGEYADLKTKADSYDKIVASIMGRKADLTTDEVTPESIIEFLNSNNEPDNDSELKNRLNTVNEDLKKSNLRIQELETENKNLRESPSEESLQVKTKTETTGEIETIADFANKNIGNTDIILAKAKEEGLI